MTIVTHAALSISVVGVVAIALAVDLAVVCCWLAARLGWSDS
jgi:hypothetical protein